MSKSGKNILIAFCGLFFRCGVYTGSILLSVFAILNIEYVAENTSGVTRDWNNDLISQIVNENATLNLQPYEYVDFWKAKFPGTVLGCYCTVRNSRRNVYPGLFRRECSRNETRTGCLEIAPQPAQDFLKFSSQAIVPVIRIANSSFNKLKNATDENGNCIQGYKNCSDFCVPGSIVDCPLTNIHIGVRNTTNPDPSTYDKAINFPNFTVFTTNKPTFHTITDLVINEGSTCVSPSTTQVTEGRKAYQLLATDWNGCIVDKRYKKLDSLGEKSLFTYNDFSWTGKGFINYDTSDSYLWYRHAASIVRLRTECQPTQEAISEKYPSRLRSFKTTAWVLVIILWVFYGISLIFNFFTAVVSCMLNQTWGSDEYSESDEIFLRIIKTVLASLDLLGLVMLMAVVIVFAKTTMNIFSITTMDCFKGDNLLDTSVYSIPYTAAKTKVLYRFLGATIMQAFLALYSWTHVSFIYTEHKQARTVF